MSIKRDIVDHWLALSRDELVDAVRLVVKQHDASAKRTWAAVRENPLLAAKVRGALSAVRADVLGSRDEVMWLMWINEARQSLDQSAEPEAQVRVERSVSADPAGELDGEREISLEIPAPIQPRKVSAGPGVPSVMFQQPGA